MGLTLGLQRRKELIKITAIFAAIAFLSFLFTRIFIAAWEQEAASYHLIWGIGYLIGNTDVVFIFPVGVYFGLLLLVTLDRMKHVQGGLLAIGTLIGSILLWADGQLWQNVNWTNNVIGLFGGFLTGVLLGGGKKIYFEQKPYEFRWAIRWLLLFIGAGIVVALAEIHLIYTTPIDSAANTLSIDFESFSVIGIDPRGLISNLSFSVALLGLLFYFTSYDYKQSFMVLGPMRSGKTTLMTGAFHTADEMTDGYANASDDLIEYRTELINPEPGFGKVDLATKGREGFELYFDFDHGELLKKRVEVNAIDHSGEMLTELKDDIDRARGKPLTNRITADSEEQEDSEFANEAAKKIAENVISADCLIITIPLDDFIPSDVDTDLLPDYYRSFESRTEPYEYLGEYEKILSSLQSEDDKEVIIVATMSDLLIDVFIHEVRESNEPLTTEQDHLEFEQWIRNEVLGHQISRLLEFSSMDTIVSVYFEMNQNVHAGSQRKPKPNPVLPDGRVKFVGGERLLRQLGE